jgi:endonuclease YncB( thermonuclease family)
MKRPPHGLYLPCSVHRVRDGDTVEISFPGSDRVWALRLLDCWAPETRGPTREAGLEAKHFAERCIELAGNHVSVYIPAPSDPIHLLGAVSFDRLLGHLFLTDDNTLSEAMVKHGHATREKQPR